MKGRIRIALIVVVSCTGMVIGSSIIAIARSIPVKTIMMVLSKVKIA